MKYCKHTKYNEISFLAIEMSGRFCRITIKYDHINQLIGMYDKDRNENDKSSYIQRMIDVGSEVTQEEFKEIADFYAKNTSRMLNGELKEKELKELIKKHNLHENKAEIIVGIKGNYKLDF